MIGDVAICAREECGDEFTKRTHNQKYCGTPCCRIATNQKIKDKYHERVAIRRGKKRVCAECGTALSRYNESKVCGSCQISKRNENLGEAARLVGSVSWL